MNNPGGSCSFTLTGNPEAHVDGETNNYEFAHGSLTATLTLPDGGDPGTLSASW